METYVRTTLRIDSHRRIHYNQIFLQKYINRLLDFLEEEPYMNSIAFAKETMEYQELKANNNIEGINDDLSIIEETIRNKNSIPNNKKERIINLHKGYRYILSNKEINKENLKELYSILSNGLLDDYSIQNMGKYYRQRPVYILKDGRLDIEPYQGMPAKQIEKYMDRFFDFINTHEANTDMENFIKSQIMHFYFVYVHPYFDVNGRTSRTVSMWHLLNNKAYPYIVFNRAISFSKSKYEKRIIAGRNHGDITLFLRYILKEVLKELEKEKVINNIKINSDYLTKEEIQLIEYLLTLKGQLTLFDLTNKYNAYNVYKSSDYIAENYVYPLIKKGILLNEGATKHKVIRNMPNIKLAISRKMINIEPEKIKSFSLEKYIK